MSFADIRDTYPHFATRREEFNSGKIRTWLGVPMVVASNVIGMIALDRNVVDPFDDEEIEVVQASQITLRSPSEMRPPTANCRKRWRQANRLRGR